MQIFLFFNNTKQILIIYQMFQTYLSIFRYEKIINLKNHDTMLTLCVYLLKKILG